MHHSHQLEKQTHQDFLLQQRVDPITGEAIEAGHKIVICSACKSAFFEESWEYLGRRHCNQTQTLTQIPVTESLWLKAKPFDFLPFKFEGFDKETHYQNTVYTLIQFLLLLIFSIPVLLPILLQEMTNFSLLIGLSFFAISAFIVLVNLKSIITKFFDKYKKHIFPIPKEKHKLAIDSERKTFVFRTDSLETKLSFSDVDSLYYNYRFFEKNKTEQENIYELRVILYLRKGIRDRTIDLTTLYRKKQITKWEKFLNDLPDSIKVQVGEE